METKAIGGLNNLGNIMNPAPHYGKPHKETPDIPDTETLENMLAERKGKKKRNESNIKLAKIGVIAGIVIAVPTVILGMDWFMALIHTPNTLVLHQGEISTLQMHESINSQILTNIIDNQERDHQILVNILQQSRVVKQPKQIDNP